MEMMSGFGMRSSFMHKFSRLYYISTCNNKILQQKIVIRRNNGWE